MNFTTVNLLLKAGMDFNHKKIRGCGLSDTELCICSFVTENEKCSQDDIVKALKIDKTTVAKAVKALELKECLTRCRHEADKRQKELTLTEKGKACIQGVANLHDKWLNSIMKCLNKSEATQFEEYMTRLLKEAEKLAAEENA